MLFKLSIVSVVLACISSTLVLTLIFAKSASANHSPDHNIGGLQAAMEKASDTCEASLPRSVQSAQGIVTMARSNCAVMVRAGYEALRRARFSPRGYNLTTDSGVLRYVNAGVGILRRDAVFMSSARDAGRFIPRNVMRDLLYGVVGVHLYLDHGINPNTGLLVR